MSTARRRARCHLECTSVGPHRRAHWLAAIVGSLAISTLLASSPGFAAPLPLPSLHKVAGWLAVGAKDKVATHAVLSQLPGDEFGWIPQSTCLTTAINSTNATSCTLGDLSSTTTVVLLGDSSADEWALDLGRLGTTDHFRLVVYVHAACPVGGVLVELQGHAVDPRCASFRSQALADIAGMHPVPNLVVISELRLSNYVTSSGAPLSNAVWSSALTTTLQGLVTDGDAVAILHGVPLATKDPASCIAAYPRALGRCATKRTSADAKGYDAATWAGARAARAAGVNVQSLFCTATTCPSVADGDVLQSGDNHVTERYASAVESAFGELLGCAVTQTFANDAGASSVLRSLDGGSPSKAVLTACRRLAH